MRFKKNVMRMRKKKKETKRKRKRRRGELGWPSG